MRLWVQCANPSHNRNPVLYAAVGTVRKPEPNHNSQSCPICGCGYSAQARAPNRNPVLYAAVGTVRKPEP